MLIAFEFLKQHGMLLENLNPYIQLLIMYPAASWASTAPDLDRGKIKSDDQSPLNLAVGGCLHLMHAKHRSWQTHCLLFTGGLAVALPLILELCRVHLGTFDSCIIQLLVYGLTTGILSHLLLDALTPEGIHIIPYVKLSLVPKLSFFSTGGFWEKIVFFSIFIANIFLLFYFSASFYFSNQLNLGVLFSNFISEISNFITNMK